MDKYEYKLKTEQMLELMGEGEYGKAAEVADTIDWKRVRNVTMLSNVSEIYEKNRDYQKSYEILNIAYHRAEGSRKIVSRLCTLALKTKNIDEAIDYYDDFVQIAPKDPNRFLLRYQILKAQRSPIEQQIEALEEYKKAEYIEEWAYELAKLYHKAGMASECIEECDDLILWFSEGKYVNQAMELKMKYKPLTPSQKEKYDKRNEISSVTEEMPDLSDLALDEEEEVEEAVQESEEEPVKKTETPETKASKEPVMKETAAQDTSDSAEKDANFIGSTMKLDEALKKLLHIGEPEEEEPEIEMPEEEEDSEPEETDVDEMEVIEEEDLEELEGAISEIESVMDLGLAEEIFEEKKRRIFKVDSDLEELTVDSWDDDEEVSVVEIEALEEPEEELIEDVEEFAEEAVEDAEEFAEEAVEDAEEFAEEAVEDAEEFTDKDIEDIEIYDEEPEEPIEEFEEEFEEEKPVKKSIEPILPPDIQRLIDEIEGVIPETNTVPVTQEDIYEEIEDEPHENMGIVTEQLRLDAILSELEDEDDNIRLYEDLLDEDDDDDYEADTDYEADIDEYAYADDDYDDEDDDYEVDESDYDDDIEDYEEELEDEEMIYEPEDYEEELEFDESDAYSEEEYIEYDESEEYEEEASEFDDAEEYEEEEEFELDESEEYKEEEEFELDESEEYEEEEEFESDESEEYEEEEEFELDESEEYEEEEEFELGESEEYEEEDDEYELVEDIDFELEDEDGEEYEDDEYEFEEEEDAAFAIQSSLEEEFSLSDAEDWEDDREIPDEEEEIDILSATTPLSRKETAKLIATGKTSPIPMGEIADALSLSGTGFVVHGRYDLKTQSGIGTRAGLTEEQKKLFSYFVPVRGMSEQLVDVLEQDKNCTNRKGTSCTGNLVVIGNKGNGKTVLAVDVVKAIQKQRKIRQGKVAIVTGDALNQKKIPDIVSKLYGGALIIEKAGKMNEKTVSRLNKIMERDTGEMLIVLEDQRKPLDRLLSSNREFRRKFTSRLEVPIFINDELVTFGQTYAQENGYRIDEMGILALYSRIDMLQREDHAVTVAEVKDVMDEAIARSKKASAKKLVKRVFGKNTDSEDRIILGEKEFNI